MDFIFLSRFQVVCTGLYVTVQRVVAICTNIVVYNLLEMINLFLVGNPWPTRPMSRARPERPFPRIQRFKGPSPSCTRVGRGPLPGARAVLFIYVHIYSSFVNGPK